MTTTETAHGVPHRYYRAWRRTCATCDHKVMDTFPLHIHLACRYGCGTMDQAPQGTPPDIETVTEWLWCDPAKDDQWQCIDHRPTTT